MNRKELREMSRFYMQELLERPEGLIKDEDAAETDLNNLINIAQHSVQVDLIPYIPEWFRKSFLFSIEANIGDYHIEDDISVTDFLRMEDIYHNESGKKPQGLTYIKADQLQQYDITVGEKGEPKVWLWEARLTIGLRPIPSSTILSRYKAYYFFKIPDLNQDTEHSPYENKFAIPPFPDITQELIAIDAVKRSNIASEDDVRNIDAFYKEHLTKAKDKLFSIEPSLSSRARPTLEEMVR